MRNSRPRPEAGQVWLAAASLPHPHRPQATVWVQRHCLPGSWNQESGWASSTNSGSAFPWSTCFDFWDSRRFPPVSCVSSTGCGPSQRLTFWMHRFHDHLWAPQTQSSILSPQNPEPRHTVLTYIRGKVPAGWGRKGTMHPGTPQASDNQVPGSQSLQKDCRTKDKFPQAPSPDMACCREQGGDS